MNRSVIIILGVGLLSGCFVNTFNGVSPECENNSIGGCYSIKEIESDGLDINKRLFMKDERGKGIFEEKEEAMPITIKVSSERTNPGLSPLQGIGVVPACCTWFAWPLCTCEERHIYKVGISSDVADWNHSAKVVVDEDRWFSLLTPLAFIAPLFADEYLIGEEHPRADDRQEKRNKVARELVVEAVWSVLNEETYNEYICEKKKRAIAERKHVLQKNADAKAEKLRVFAIKEAPTIWRTIKDFQGYLAVVDSKLDALRDDLVEFNLDPENDGDYIRIRQMRDDMQRNLCDLNNKLQEAYLASKKYEAMPSRKDYAEMQRRTLEEGIREAEAASAKYRDLSSGK